MKWTGLSYFLVVLLLSGCGGRPDSIPSANSVLDLLSVEIDGLEQWLLIRGEDRTNPVLLWLHGGPGSAQMPIHHAYTKALEKEYIVVYWDQRGTGKSNHADFREESMTINRFVKDAYDEIRINSTTK